MPKLISKSRVDFSVIHEFDRHANLTVASQEVLLLPPPEDTVSIGGVRYKREESKCVSVHSDNTKHNLNSKNVLFQGAKQITLVLS